MGNLANLTFPITKRTQQPDGSVIIEGPVTDDSLDLDGQIVDPVTAAKSLQDWFDEYGNVRQQHSPILAPAGKAISLVFKQGVPWIKAHILEPTAVKLVMAKVYQAFSIGIADGQLDTSPAACKRAPNGILFPSLVNEVSITDYPANVGMGKFVVAKRKGGLVRDVAKITGIQGDAFAEALKSSGANFSVVVHTAKSPKKAQALIGTQFDAREYEALGNVIVMKRDFDPGVGGGTDRDTIPAKDFADKKNRKYPIVTPGDVSDAASLIGKADDPEAIKARIIAIAQRKGPQFVAELPKTWRNEMGKSQKAAGTEDGKPFEGAAEPFGKKDNETEEEKAARKAAKKAKKAGKIPEADQKVTDDLKKADDAVGDAKDDQADDNAQHMASGDDGGDDDGDSKDDDADAKGMEGKVGKGGKKKLAKAARRMAKAAAKAKAAADNETAMAMKRAHDALCPVYKGSVTKSFDSVTDVIDPEMFRQRLMAASADSVETRTARNSAYMASAQVATLKMSDFNALRRVAHKAFKDAYPDVKVASPDLSDPSSFQRGFLPSANKEVATSMSHPSNFPDDKPLEASQFTRGPLVANQARPSLVGGTPAAALKSRTFYTNDAKDKNADAMATLHDHIVSNYPDVCPAGMGLADETGDRLGTTPSMYSHAPGTDTLDAGADSTLSNVDEMAMASAVKRAVDEAVKPLLIENKQLSKKTAKLSKKLRRELAKPDWTKSAHRTTQFGSPSDNVTPISEGKRADAARVKTLVSRITDRNSGATSGEIEELQSLVSPEQYAALMTANDN